MNVSSVDYSLKQHNTAENPGCYLDSTHDGGSMTHKVLRKINARVNFLFRQNNYLNYCSKRLLCNTLIPYFDYGCRSWHPLLSKALKAKL